MKIKAINKNLKKTINKNLFLLIFILLLLVSFDFFKNVFHLIKYDKNERLIRNSEFCEKDSQGFVVYLKEKYNFKDNPFLLNNTISPLSDWVYFDFKKKNEKKKLILLNYEELQEIDAKLSKSVFLINQTPPLMKNIIGIKIHLKNVLSTDQSFLIKLFKIEDGKKNMIYSEDILFKKNLISKLIHLNFDEMKGSKLRLYGIDIKPFNENIFQNVKLLVQNKIELKKYTIIEKKQNCYYLKKND
ncbi:hypothetical protein N8728_04870 [Candidatus Pelagibacter sp.]|nr:hypothetical protein [Candidatus Pelagibacter sp.]